MAPLISKLNRNLSYQLSATVRGLINVASRTECDTHAATCVVGKHCLITHEFDRVVSVTGYDPNQGRLKI